MDPNETYSMTRQKTLGGSPTPDAIRADHNLILWLHRGGFEPDNWTDHDANLYRIEVARYRQDIQEGFIADESFGAWVDSH